MLLVPESQRGKLGKWKHVIMFKATVLSAIPEGESWIEGQASGLDPGPDRSTFGG